MKIRAVCGARVSSYDDVKQVSPAIQRESGERYVNARKDDGWGIVGYFEDLDVSASISPWDRPDLGPWLDAKADEWDAMIFAKVDRAFRSSKDCADVAHWAEQNHKILVFADDGIVLNFRNDADQFATQMAKMFLFMASLFAEMELKRIRKRVQETQTYIRTKDRWAGGHAPYGYRTVDHPEGQGKTLAIDPESKEHVRFMARLIVEGKSLWEVAEALNSTGVATPTNYRVANGAKSNRKTEVKGTWTQAQVGQILRNQSCMGVKMQGRGTAKRVIRGSNGLPIPIAEPLFTEDEWRALQTAMDKRTVKRERSKGAAALLGVVYCLGCGERLHKSTTNVREKSYTYYRCQKTADKPGCKGYSFKEDRLIHSVETRVLPMLAKIPVTRKVFEPGEDHTRELDQVKKNLAGLREERDMGAYDVQGGEDEYKTRLMALVTQRKILEALPQREDSWIDEPTGETYAEAYARMDIDGRRNLLLTSDVRLYCSPTERQIRVPRALRGYGEGVGNPLPELVVITA